MNQQLFKQLLPFSLLGILFVIALVTVFTLTDHYGLTIDEVAQDKYGQIALAWYTTFGRDASFLKLGDHQAEHGAIFEVMVAVAQHLFGHQWQTRAVITGLAGVVGVLAIALCGFELGGWWAAFLAALSLWLYPRFFGAIFNNSKDVPFTSLMLLVLWSVIVLLRQWDIERKYLINSIRVGFFLGFAIAVRVNAIIWYAVLMLLLAGWWMYSGRSIWREKQVKMNLGKQVYAAGLILAISWITVIALWPYAALNPLLNPYHAITIMSKYPWHVPIPFAGQMYYADELPSSYVPTWLVIGSPPALLLFTGVGFLSICFRLLRDKKVEMPLIVICLALLLPLGALVLLRPTLYDGLRQFLFLVPLLILLAVYGFMRLFTFLVDGQPFFTVGLSEASHNRRPIWGTVRSIGHLRTEKTFLAMLLLVVVLASQVQVIAEMYVLDPYEYMYFSPIVGGVPGANGRYDMDYWGTCQKPATEWLAQNYTKYTHTVFPTFTAVYVEPVKPYLPEAFKEDKQNPDFYVSTTRFSLDRLFPLYKVIHQEVIQGYVACIVKVNPALASASKAHQMTPALPSALIPHSLSSPPRRDAGESRYHTPDGASSRKG